jgi:hypothetical protein
MEIPTVSGRRLSGFAPEPRRKLTARTHSELPVDPRHLVETYLAQSAAAERGVRERRARSAAEELTRETTVVSFDHSVHVPEDEICFFVFDAPSMRDVLLAAERAELDPIRVVEAVSPSSPKEDR